MAISTPDEVCIVFESYADRVILIAAERTYRVAIDLDRFLGGFGFYTRTHTQKKKNI